MRCILMAAAALTLGGCLAGGGGSGGGGGGEGGAGGTPSFERPAEAPSCAEFETWTCDVDEDGTPMRIVNTWREPGDGPRPQERTFDDDPGPDGWYLYRRDCVDATWASLDPRDPLSPKTWGVNYAVNRGVVEGGYRLPDLWFGFICGEGASSAYLAHYYAQDEDGGVGDRLAYYLWPEHHPCIVVGEHLPACDKDRDGDGLRDFEDPDADGDGLDDTDGSDPCYRNTENTCPAAG